MIKKNDLFDKELYKEMCTLCGRTNISARCNNGGCDGDYVTDPYCVDKNNICIPPIKDCLEHFETCTIGCHDNCKCQERHG